MYAQGIRHMSLSSGFCPCMEDRVGRCLGQQEASKVKEKEVSVTCTGHHLCSTCCLQGSHVSETGCPSKIRDENIWKDIQCLTG